MLACFSALCCTILLALLVGCGGSPKGKGAVKSPPIHSSDAGPSPSKSDGNSQPTTLSEEKCEALFEHVFALAFTDHQAETKAEERANEADLAKAKSRIREELLAVCVGADREGFGYNCAMAAGDVPAVKTCMQ